MTMGLIICDQALAYYAQFFSNYAFEQCSKKLPIMLNIMPITTATVHIQLLLLITRLA